jgi:hypothetical protein
MIAMHLFSCLGALAIGLTVGCATPVSPDLRGQWGGPHLNLTITDGGGTAEFDCARGALDPLGPATPGHAFTATGTFIHEAGPEPIEGRPRRPARFTGVTRKGRLSLTVTLTDLNEILGPFVLERGITVPLVKCR